MCARFALDASTLEIKSQEHSQAPTESARYPIN
jgi:hypothetical protein